VASKGLAGRVFGSEARIGVNGRFPGSVAKKGVRGVLNKGRVCEGAMKKGAREERDKVTSKLGASGFVAQCQIT